ncbi:hypothetical protein [Amycolatopsis arida]|uniref:hypothetical protein n=1 Tax=Amycolatopsis arida TaxID=587909 RepID=UPI00106549AE|nr:hypothetical protein [Amycolatopsis arida]
MVVLIVAPVAIVVLVPVLVAVARPGHRARTARAALPPVLTGLFSTPLLVVVALPVPGVTPALDHLVAGLSQGALRVPLVTLAVEDTHPMLVLGLLWMLSFFVAVACLTQRNGLCARQDNDLVRLIAPLLSVWGDLADRVDQAQCPGAGPRGTATVAVHPVHARDPGHRHRPGRGGDPEVARRGPAVPRTPAGLSTCEGRHRREARAKMSA